MTPMMSIPARGLAVALCLAALTGSANAAGEALKIERQKWSFSGITGTFDQAQLQRGFQVYKEVCAACHGLGRIAFRNLAEPGGPEFPAEAVKQLAATYQVKGEPNDDGKVVDRPGLPADRFPPLFANEKEARSIHNGALPPDLSVIAKARGVEYTGSVWMHPLSMARDIATGYQEGGADYLYALLTGYLKDGENPPQGFQLADGMNYNKAFPGQQIAMVNPFAGGDGQVSYQDGTPATVDNYARDVTAFLAWAADPHHDARKRLGWQVLLYLVVTSLLLYVAKRRIWSKVPH